jgi:hypothetical protein
MTTLYEKFLHLRHQKPRLAEGLLEDVIGLFDRKGRDPDEGLLQKMDELLGWWLGRPSPLDDAPRCPCCKRRCDCTNRAACTARRPGELAAADSDGVPW